MQTFRDLPSETSSKYQNGCSEAVILNLGEVGKEDFVPQGALSWSGIIFGCHFWE